ncbi:Ryncolin-4 [Holothuria leucospilota]|uniref:Ryncolin-4 n=1 Tax=Holothuria leucospilota TaxID=206669 RepID=A0A9Q1BVP0_HOLLE|nr:Ryncolin-4 [Holothuria leucospilota]
MYVRSALFATVNVRNFHTHFLILQVIQRRVNDSVDFQRTYEDYQKGFGNLKGNFWLGNEKIFLLTNQMSYQLRIDRTFHESYFTVYSNFRISNSTQRFQLEELGEIIAGLCMCVCVGVCMCVCFFSCVCVCVFFSCSFVVTLSNCKLESLLDIARTGIEIVST